MARHFIIVNPFDSLVKFSKNVAESIRKKIMSSPAYCSKALSSFELSKGAKEIISFLSNSNSSCVVIVSPYEIVIAQMVADHFGLKSLNIYQKVYSYESIYRTAMNDFSQPEDNTAVITGHYKEVDSALKVGIAPIFYSESLSCSKTGCISATEVSGVLKGLGYAPAKHK